MMAAQPLSNLERLLSITERFTDQMTTEEHESWEEVAAWTADAREQDARDVLLTEDELFRMLVGPTSGAKARMLAARVFGTWDEDTQTHKETGIGPDHRTGGAR